MEKLAIAAVLMSSTLASAAPAAQAQTARASTSATGVEGDGDSGRVSLSGDGRLATFVSKATNLVPGDANHVADIFVKDLATGAVRLASVADDGTQANSYCLYPVISADGRCVAYYSHASNLVPGDANGAGDIFLHDLHLARTELVSVSSTGAQGDLASRGVAIDATGRCVAFASFAGNLAPGDVNGVPDVFLRDRALGTTVLVSVTPAGVSADAPSGAPSPSADGRFVAFASLASDLVPGDQNACDDVFVRDLWNGTTQRVSVASNGAEGDGDSGLVHASGYRFTTISSDGRFVAFQSYATNLVPGDSNGVADVFVHDRALGTLRRASLDSRGKEPSEEAAYPVVFDAGRRVAFSSRASELAALDHNGAVDVFVHDFDTGATLLVGTASDGARGDLASDYPVVSEDGRVLAFESYATNLVPGDSNAKLDVFVIRLAPPPAPVVFCAAAANSLGCVPRVLADGAASASSTGACRVRAEGVRNRVPGILLSGRAKDGVPFAGGTLCIAPPLARLAGGSSGGSPPPSADCSGSLAFDVNPLVQAGGPAQFPLGSLAFFQVWSRDAAAPSHAHLSRAVCLAVAP